MRVGAGVLLAVADGVAVESVTSLPGGVSAHAIDASARKTKTSAIEILFMLFRPFLANPIVGINPDANENEHEDQCCKEPQPKTENGRDDENDEHGDTDENKQDAELIARHSFVGPAVRQSDQYPEGNGQDDDRLDEKRDVCPVVRVGQVAANDLKGVHESPPWNKRNER